MCNNHLFFHKDLFAQYSIYNIRTCNHSNSKTLCNAILKIGSFIKDDGAFYRKNNRKRNARFSVIFSLKLNSILRIISFSFHSMHHQINVSSLDFADIVSAFIVYEILENNNADIFQEEKVKFIYSLEYTHTVHSFDKTFIEEICRT